MIENHFNYSYHFSLLINIFALDSLDYDEILSFFY